MVGLILISDKAILTPLVVVPKIKHRKKKVVEEYESETEPITESESTTDVETKKIRKRVDRRVAILDKIDKQLNEPVKPVMSPFERLLMTRM